MPHALLHVPEHVHRGGHFAAFCTFLAEVSHKEYIKLSATFSRTEASHNESQKNMLNWVLWQRIFDEVLNLLKNDDGDPQNEDADGSQDNGETRPPRLHIKLLCPLSYMDTWSNMRLLTELPDEWGSKFFSKKVRVTQGVLLSILCKKINLEDSSENRLKLVQTLSFRCFGTIMQKRDQLRRKFVGISSTLPTRRDFVRIAGRHDHTCLSAQILMFVHITDFADVDNDFGIVLPQNYRSPPANTSSVTFALIRWLSPHPDALLRDKQFRPIAPSPLDINHALWTFTKSTEPQISMRTMRQNIRCYDGLNNEQRLGHAMLESRAVFDLVTTESLDTYINCTRVNTNTDHDTILETISIPF